MDVHMEWGVYMDVHIEWGVYMDVHGEVQGHSQDFWKGISAHTVIEHMCKKDHAHYQYICMCVVAS